jgi:hypothetical protein
MKKYFGSGERSVGKIETAIVSMPSSHQSSIIF